MRVRLHNCKRCHHEWAARDIFSVPEVKNTVLAVPSHILSRPGRKEPKYCPHCKSPYWNRERKREVYAGGD